MSLDEQSLYIQLLKPLSSEVIGPYFTLLQDVPIKISIALRYYIFTQPPYHYSCPPTEKERLEIQARLRLNQENEERLILLLPSNYYFKHC